MPATGARKSAGGARNRNGRKPASGSGTSFGARLIAGLEELVTTLEEGGMAAVEKKFTVKRVKVVAFPKPALSKREVVAIRESLGASQPVFANLLGVSPATVRAWEQGVNTPSGMALRFLAEIRANPEYWKARLREAATA